MNYKYCAVLLAAVALAGCTSKKTSICEQFAAENLPKGAIISEVKVAKSDDGACSVLASYDTGSSKIRAELVGSYKAYGDDVVYELESINVVAHEQSVYPAKKGALLDVISDFNKSGAFNEDCTDYLKNVVALKDSYLSDSWRRCGVPDGLQRAVKEYTDAQPIPLAPSREACAELVKYHLPNASMQPKLMGRREQARATQEENQVYDVEFYAGTEDGKCDIAYKQQTTLEEDRPAVSEFNGESYMASTSYYVEWEYNLQFTYRTLGGGVSVSNNDPKFSRKELSRKANM